jgi:hypothetical protein
LSERLEQARVRFLGTLEIARRELAVLDYSHARLFARPIDEAWVRGLEADMEAAETLEAFASRFGRFQDTVGDKLIPRLLTALLERPGSQIDNLNRAERLGWIGSAAAWITARELRNRLIREYRTDAAAFAADIRAAGDFVPMFRATYARLLRAAEDRFGAGEQDLGQYLDPVLTGRG